MLKGENLKNAENFTVLELWNERGFPYIHILLARAGRNIVASYKARCNTIPETVEVYEEIPGRTFIVNQYPADFRKGANIILTRMQKKYKQYFNELRQLRSLPENKPPTKPKEKQARAKRPRIKTTS